MGDHDIMMQESLSAGLTNCKVTSRADITTGIFMFPKLLYFSDNEDEDSVIHPNFREDNLQGAVPQDIPEPAAFQSLEPIFNPLSDEQVRKIMALSNEGNPLLIDEDIVALPEKPSNMEWIEFLVKKGPHIVATPKNRNRTSKILRKLGGEIKVLPPGNELTENDILGECWTNTDRSQWRKLLSALVSELLTVEAGCSSEVRDGGVFVLSKLQYPVLLELMAQEIENDAVL